MDKNGVLQMSILSRNNIKTGLLQYQCTMVTEFRYYDIIYQYVVDYFLIFVYFYIKKK